MERIEYANDSHGSSTKRLWMVLSRYATMEQQVILLMDIIAGGTPGTGGTNHNEVLIGNDTATMVARWF